MRSLVAEATITTSWLEIEAAFDLVRWGINTNGTPIEVEEYLETGWGPTLSSGTEQLFSRHTSAQKIRVRTVSGTVLIKYSLLGFVAFRVNGYSGYSGDCNFDRDGDSVIPKTDRAALQLEGKGSEPTTPTAEHIKEFVQVTGTTPNKLTKVAYKDSDGDIIIISTKLQ